jgi:hypothetical protein
MRRLLVPLVLLPLLLVLLADACGYSDIYLWAACEYPDFTLENPCDPRRQIPCRGECVPLGPQRRLPVLLWSGASAEEPPECPARAPDQIAEGFGDLTFLHECPPCGCETSTGSCELPTTFTANAALCPATGAETTSFNAPSGWDGTCDAATMIPKDLPCTTGPCVQSLSIAPLVKKEQGCMVKADPVPSGAPYKSIPDWKMFMRACSGQVLDEAEPCGDPSLYCVPSAEPPPPGFSQCIEMTGVDEPCPEAEYTERRALYTRWSYNDSRWCTKCQCGDPVGSDCWSFIQIYSTNNCSGVPFFGGAVTSDPFPCAPITAGTAVGSKQAEPPVYIPGTCEPIGGEKTGTVEPVDPVAVFCCQNQER